MPFFGFFQKDVDVPDMEFLKHVKKQQAQDVAAQVSFSLLLVCSVDVIRSLYSLPVFILRQILQLKLFQEKFQRNRNATPDEKSAMVRKLILFVATWNWKI